jgi:hypothetical protein
MSLVRFSLKHEKLASLKPEQSKNVQTITKMYLTTLQESPGVSPESFNVLLHAGEEGHTHG